MKKLTELEEKIAVIKKQRDELLVLRQSIDKKLILANNELNPLEEQLNEILAKINKDNWEWLLHEDGPAIREKHRVLNYSTQRVLHKLIQ